MPTSFELNPGTISQRNVQVCGGGLYQVTASFRQLQNPALPSGAVSFCLGTACGDSHWMSGLAPAQSGKWGPIYSQIWVPCGQGGPVTLKIRMDFTTTAANVAYPIAVDEVSIANIGGVSCGC
jgi:hypothetical protein